jgi:transcriptional regulator with XRE-family HTH domain
MHRSLATKLRVLRAERGLTVRQAAEISGVAKETISQIERGERHPYDRTIAKLAHAYDVPVEELLEEPVLAGSPKAEPPPETGPASLTREQAAASLQRLQSPPEIELDQLHDHGIPASHADVRTLNMYLEGFWRAQRTGQPFAVASLAKDNVDYEHIALLATYVLTTTKEPRFLTPEQVEAVHQGIHDQLVGARG